MQKWKGNLHTETIYNLSKVILYIHIHKFIYIRILWEDKVLWQTEFIVKQAWNRIYKHYQSNQERKFLGYIESCIYWSQTMKKLQTSYIIICQENCMLTTIIRTTKLISMRYILQMLIVLIQGYSLTRSLKKNNYYFSISNSSMNKF